MTHDPPIFVVGAPRSGTTLLRYMLCSHPRIYLPPESNFLPRFFRRNPTAPLSRGRALAVLDAIARYPPFWRDWVGRPLDPVALVDRLEVITPTTLVDALYREYAERHGAGRWGDKSPIYASHLPLIATLFPEAKILHIVRDARDVTASSLTAYRGPRFFYMDAYYAACTWRRRVEDARRDGRTLSAGRYLEIRYEDLTREPTVVLHELCRFLGEEFDPAMASPQGEARRHHHSSGIHRRVRRPVTSARAGRWRRDLAPADARLVQSVTAPTLRMLGYPVEDLGPATAAERARGAALRVKYVAIEAGRRTVTTLGVGHPTRLLEPGRRRAPAFEPGGERTNEGSAPPDGSGSDVAAIGTRSNVGGAP